MAGEVKTFFDNWLLKFDFYREFKMRNKVGAAFATGGSISNGKEITLVAILEAMLINKMIVISAGGSYGFGASATTGPDSRRNRRQGIGSCKRSWQTRRGNCDDLQSRLGATAQEDWRPPPRYY